MLRGLSQLKVNEVEFGFVADSRSGALGGAVYNYRNIKGFVKRMYILTERFEGLPTVIVMELLGFESTTLLAITLKVYLVLGTTLFIFKFLDAGLFTSINNDVQN